MFANRSNPDVAAQADLMLAQLSEGQKYISTLYRQHDKLIWDNKKATPQMFAATLGSNAAKAIKVQAIVQTALNAIADVMGDPTLKVTSSQPAGASVTPLTDGTVSITTPTPAPATAPTEPPTADHSA